MLIVIFSAYELYRDSGNDSDKAKNPKQVGSQKKISMADRFKNAFSHKGVRVHFVGAWCVISALPPNLCLRMGSGIRYHPSGLYVGARCSRRRPTE